jgi:hypothetical protein
MITVFVPDSTADDVHERQVPVTLEAGLEQAAYAALAADCVAIGLEDDREFLTRGAFYGYAKYEERDGCGVIWGDSDGRGHNFGVVVGPDEAVCRRVAQELLNRSISSDDYEDDDSDNDGIAPTMLTLAAIAYMIDQNEPSRPFLLELDLPQEPTAEQLRDALLAHQQAARLEANQHLLRDRDGQPLEGEQLELALREEFPPLLVARETSFGDLVVGSVDEDTMVFVGLPERLAGLAEQFPYRQQLGI